MNREVKHGRNIGYLRRKQGKNREKAHKGK